MIERLRIDEVWQFDALPRYALFKIDGRGIVWQKIDQHVARGGMGLSISTFPATMYVQRIYPWTITPTP